MMEYSGYRFYQKKVSGMTRKILRRCGKICPRFWLIIIRKMGWMQRAPEGSPRHSYRSVSASTLWKSRPSFLMMTPPILTGMRSTAVFEQALESEDEDAASLAANDYQTQLCKDGWYGDRTTIGGSPWRIRFRMFLRRQTAELPKATPETHRPRRSMTFDQDARGQRAVAFDILERGFI